MMYHESPYLIIHMEDIMNNQHYLLACNRIHGFGPRRIARCMQRWPDLADLFKASEAELRHVGLPAAVVHALQHFDFREVDADVVWLKQTDTHVLTWESPDYPALLTEIYDPPPVLYAQGDISCLQQLSLAVVGTRHPSPTGQETAWRFASELAQVPLTIVSGLALGIDAQAHRGCLHAGGKTVAVLGTGIDMIYPRQHQRLAANIVDQGVLLSEFPLKNPPNNRHFPQRNRIISGLAKATLVVEAALRSGSLITARLAMEQNRDVFAIPGSIHLPQARGCHHLLQQGATLVTSPQDVKEAMGLSVQHFLKSIPIPLKVCDNQKVLSYFGFEATTIDQIADRSGLLLDDILCAVADLELQGCIRIVPGGYMRCRE